MSKVLGQEIKYKERSMNELKQQLKTQNLSADKIEGIASFYDAANKSDMYYVTSDFKKLTGQDPGKIQDFLMKHKECFVTQKEE